MLGSIYKKIKKPLDFEDVAKELLDDRIHTLFNDWKIINKLNWNANSYYVNLELVDLETHNLKSSQSVQRKSLTTTDSLSNFNDTPAFSVNKTPQLQGVTLTPAIYVSNSSEDKRALNINETQWFQNLPTYRDC